MATGWSLRWLTVSRSSVSGSHGREATQSACRIVAVTKGFGPEQVAAGLAVGIAEFGENYAEELLAKWPATGGAVTWHFLGAVQRNKVGRLARFVDCWQGVARVVEGEAIVRHRSAAGRGGRRGAGTRRRSLWRWTRPGLRAGAAAPRRRRPAIVERLSERGCSVDGLMTVAPPGDQARAREAFDQVARLGAQLGLGELSMGMSDDLEQAVAAGATMVRLGTALFGTRPRRRRL